MLGACEAFQLYRQAGAQHDALHCPDEIKFFQKLADACGCRGLDGQVHGQAQGRKHARCGDGKRLSAAMLARLADKVAHMHVELPSLCSCHTLSVLDPRYSESCAINCQCKDTANFHELLRSLLQAYGVVL